MSVTSTDFEIDPPEVESSSSSAEENEELSRYSRRLYAMEELEQVLPMRRGISKFYDGKSKSFTSLADVSSSSSIQEIVKPKNMYSRRRRNLLAFNRVWDNGRSSPRTGGISKRPLGSSKSTLALAVANDSSSSNFSHSPPPAIHLPPLLPRSQGSLDHHGSPRQKNSPSWMSTITVSLRGLTCCVNRPLPSNILRTGL